MVVTKIYTFFILPSVFEEIFSVRQKKITNPVCGFVHFSMTTTSNDEKGLGIAENGVGRGGDGVER